MQANPLPLPFIVEWEALLRELRGEGTSARGDIAALPKCHRVSSYWISDIKLPTVGTYQMYACMQGTHALVTRIQSSSRH